MGLTEWELRRLRAELERLGPQLAAADRVAQGRLLDVALDRAGLDPGWAEWKALARRYLPAYHDPGGPGDRREA